MKIQSTRRVYNNHKHFQDHKREKTEYRRKKYYSMLTMKHTECRELSIKMMFDRSQAKKRWLFSQFRRDDEANCILKRSLLRTLER